MQERLNHLWTDDPITACLVDDLAPGVVATRDRLARGDEVDHLDLIAFVILVTDSERYVSADRWSRTAAWLLAQADDAEAVAR